MNKKIDISNTGHELLSRKIKKKEVESAVKTLLRASNAIPSTYAKIYGFDELLKIINDGYW